MIDFRSDTVTKPTKEMRSAMANAIVGDDVYGDDPTVNQLEELAAKMTGKEAALFVPSGTMGNQLAIMTHTSRGDEFILGKNSHIKNYEVGAAATLSGVSYHLVDDESGLLDIEKVRKGIRGIDVHYPTTSLICMENAHGTGKVAPVAYMKEIYDLAKEYNIAVHTDGARIFNAAVHLNIDVKELTQYTDSLMFCLSKGLASPIGSILVGTKDFIHQARRNRKMLGGGMRQVGILAAAGLISLQEMTKRLHIDHQNAQYLASELNKLKDFTVDMDHLDINMVFVKSSYDLNRLKEYLMPKDILLGGYKGEYMRLVCHNDITKNDIDAFIQEIRYWIKER